jgi:glutathione synthase/RimK-type ligase-like ATP-grasp enzyme
MRIALLTCSRFPQLWDDDQLAATELRQRGHVVEPVIWNVPGVLAQLDTFDVVVVRNPWDWFNHREAFRAFLNELRGCRARVVNDAATLIAFADKTYLTRLEAKGVAVVPTVELAPSELRASLAKTLAAKHWTRAVLKPAFTANAIGAQVFDADALEPVLATAAQVPLANGEKWLVQPFIPSITEGERSFIFFGGVFSHAVRKLPKPGDWRVQHDYGGTSSPFAPEADAVQQATALLALAAPGTVYARVDAVDIGGRLHLMELEVVEPELFFRHEPRSVQRFADALLRAS